MTIRLQQILSAIPRCRVLCDVGCDHGYIGIGALQGGLAEQAVFVDISNDCLKKARENCPEELKTRAAFVCRDGIGDICADTAVIAGMGGLEIISILEGTEKLPKTLVLQPMRNQYDARKYILQRYDIALDYKFFDGKYYDLIVANLCDKPSKTDEMELLFGKDNLRNPSRDFVNYLKNEHNKLTKILQGCSDVTVQEKLRLVNAALAEVKEKVL